MVFTIQGTEAKQILSFLCKSVEVIVRDVDLHRPFIFFFEDADSPRLNLKTHDSQSRARFQATGRTRNTPQAVVKYKIMKYGLLPWSLFFP